MILNLVPIIVPMLITISLQDIKSRGANALNKNEVSYLIINSKVQFAIAPIEQFKAMQEAMEELEDIKSIESRVGEVLLTEEQLNKKLNAGK